MVVTWPKLVWIGKLSALEDFAETLGVKNSLC